MVYKMNYQVSKIRGKRLRFLWKSFYFKFTTFNKAYAAEKTSYAAKVEKTALCFIGKRKTILMSVTI